MNGRAVATGRFYDALNELADRTGGTKRLSEPGLSSECPRAGLYFFFEHGEVRPSGEPRVVRLGTHALTATSRTTLWGRLRNHRGTLAGTHPGGGNHRGSIFRQHVGAAILQRRGDRELLASWLASKPLPGRRTDELALEVEVSRIIRDMPFLWLDVPTRPDGSSDRGLLEQNLIALLSTAAGGTDPASSTWLGNDATSPDVRASGLWNVNQVRAAFDPNVLDLFSSYIRCHSD